jgi:glutaredoxin
MSKEFLIHTQPDCAYCTAAKRMLENKGISYQETNERSDVWPTWPAIYVKEGEKDRLVGGYRHLCDYLIHSGIL